VDPNGFSPVWKEEEEMPFYKWTDMGKDKITPEYSSAYGPNIRGEKIEVGLFSYPAGTQAKPHAHPNEQIMVILKGKGIWRIGKEEKTLGPGEAVLIPANAEHELRIVEDLELINCKDIVSGWSVKNARWEK
jgi:quercetin dioxygenase-like cupin family protein